MAIYSVFFSILAHSVLGSNLPPSSPFSFQTPVSERLLVSTTYLSRLAAWKKEEKKTSGNERTAGVGKEENGRRSGTRWKRKKVERE